MPPPNYTTTTDAFEGWQAIVRWRAAGRPESWPGPVSRLDTPPARRGVLARGSPFDG